jgi:ABC-2 type transport system permease protein
MPGWLQAFVAVNPVALLVTTVREIMEGTVTVASVLVSLIAPAVVTAVLAPVAMGLYSRRK